MEQYKPKYFNKHGLPINLLRKEQRERRQRNEAPLKKRRKRRRGGKPKSKKDFEALEREALIKKTENELKKILQNDEILSDIPEDCLPEELEAEVALAQDTATTIYIKRDGLSTLTIVLPQERPTLANLKRAIERTARLQLKRQQRERFEERVQRRLRALEDIHNRRKLIAMEPPTTTTAAINNKKENNGNDEHETQLADNAKLVALQQQHHVVASKQVAAATNNSCSGEFICSTTFNGHPHRSNVSWRFLWRAYMLFSIEMNKPIFDVNASDGRRALSEYGIENASTLKFCKREKYCGRQRQR